VPTPPKRPWRDPTLDAADDRTLRLSVVPFTPEQLEQFISYQEALLARASRAPWTDGARMEAHEHARSHSGLDNHKLEQMGAIVRSFCAKRSVLRRLRSKQGELARAPAPDEELLARLSGELARLEDATAFTRRYGEGVTALLLAREEKLLALHDAVQAAG